MPFLPHLITVVLNIHQTHNVAMASPLADYVVSLGQDGQIASRGSVSDVLKKDKTLAKEFAEGVRTIKDNEKKIDSEEPDETAKPTDGKLILAEEVAEGNVSWDAGEHVIQHFPVLDSEAHWSTSTK
jgi:ABC-type methionine transport system ATPase subunit